MTDLLDAATTTEGTPTPTPQANPPAVATGGSLPAAANQQQPPAPAQTPPAAAPNAEPAKPAASSKEPGKDPAKPAEPVAYKLAIGDTPFESEAFAKVASKLGMSQEAAQEVLASIAPALQERHMAGLQTSRNDTVKQWADETRAHPEFGGDKLDSNMSLVHRALDQVDPKLGQTMRTLLKDSGFGNKLEVLQYLAAVGRAISPDAKVVIGAPGGAAKPQSPVDRLTQQYARNRS